MRTLSGIVCIRRGEVQDYCWKEAVQSLLPIVDEMCISECESDDGTLEIILDWMKREPKIKLHPFPWTNPIGNPNWWLDWLNFAREKCTGEMIVQLDGDEILHPDSYNEVKQATSAGKTLMAKRFNFWSDSSLLIPSGFCCSDRVIRVTEQKNYLPSDWPVDAAKHTMSVAVDSDVKIMHYGFLRKRKAWFLKAREVSRIWNGGEFDPRLVAAEKHDGVWSRMEGVTGWENNLVPYMGTHPLVIHDWLKERGYRADVKSYGEVLIEKWQHVLRDCKIPTWTEMHAKAYLCEVASRSEYMVEIGTFFGASAEVMLKANPKLHLWCVDIFSAFEFNEQLCAHLLAPFIKEGRCELIKGTSDRAADMLQHMKGKLDAVWIDGCHLTECVIQDIANFLPLLKPGAELLGHDFDQPFNDVAFGVIKSKIDYKLPVPRLWSHFKK